LVAELSREINEFVDVRLTHSPDPMHREIYCHIVEIAVSSAPSIQASRAARCNRVALFLYGSGSAATDETRPINQSLEELAWIFSLT